MVVKEIKVGKTVIRIHDDSVVQTAEQVQEILRSIGKTVSRYAGKVQQDA